MGEIVCLEETKSYDINKEVDVAGGQYWRYLGEDNNNALCGQLLLVASLNIIDGYLHSLQIFYHPSTKKTGDFRIDTEEFFEKFEYVPDAEAQKIRDAEMSEVKELIDQTRNEMLIGYVDDNGMKASDAMHAIAHSGASDIDNFHAATATSVAVIERQSESIKNLAEKQKEYVSSKAVTLKENTSLLACYYTEQGQQALASVGQVFKFVKKLDSGIRTLGIFLGRGVKLTRLSSGAEAASDIPLTFYQRKLFLDEEWFFNMLDGGCDFMDFENFASAIEADFSVIERMLPSERSVVLVQYRRHDKKYFDYDEMKTFAAKFGAIMKEAALNEENKARFLLVRNGKNVFRIDSDDLKEGMRLFPTAVEIDDCYRSSKYGMRFGGVTDDSKFKPSDLEYVEARDKHDHKAVYYKRVLLMLFGVHSREPEVFGSFMGVEQYASWYMGDFQQKCCAFIHDDEDALDHKRPSATEWIGAKNKMVQPGSRIVADWGRMMDVDSAPGAYSSKVDSDHRAYMNWRPVERLALTVVKSSGGRLYVEAPCRHSWHNTERNIKVYLDRASGYLTLDDIDFGDITMYFNSRKERENYEQFIGVLSKAREVLIEETKTVEPFRAELIDAVAGYFEADAVEEVARAVDDGIRLWRAVNGGKMVPARDNTAEYAKALEAIGKNIWGSMRGDHLLPVEAYIAENGIDPVRLTMDGRGNYFLYEDAEERFWFGRETPIFLKRSKLKVGKRSCSVETASIVSAMDVPSERVIVRYKTRQPDKHIHFSVGGALEDISKMAAEAGSALEDFVINGMDDETADALIAEFKNEKPRSNHVAIPAHCYPLCLAGHYAYGGEYNWSYTKALVGLVRASGIKMVAAFGSDEAYRRLEDAIKGKFRWPASHLESLAAVRESHNPFDKFGYFEFSLDRMISVPREAIIPGSFRDDSLYSIGKGSFSKFDASFAWEQSINGFGVGQSRLSVRGYSLPNKTAFTISEEAEIPSLWRLINPLKTDSRIVSEIIMEAGEYVLVLGRETIKSVTDKLDIDPGKHAWGFAPEKVGGLIVKDDGSLKYKGWAHHEVFECDLLKSDVVSFARKVQVPIDERSARIVEEPMDVDFFEFMKEYGGDLEWKKRYYNGNHIEYIPIVQEAD